MFGGKSLSDFNKVLIPVHDKIRKHWLLVIVDIKNKCIHIANSLREAHFQRGPNVPIEATVKANPWKDYAEPILTFLQQHHQSIKRDDYTFKEEMVAQQDNAYDCGLFVMFNISALFENCQI